MTTPPTHDVEIGQARVIRAYSTAWLITFSCVNQASRNVDAAQLCLKPPTASVKSMFEPGRLNLTEPAAC